MAHAVELPTRHGSFTTARETLWPDIDKEAMAILFGSRRFHMHLYGLHLAILTEGKRLERAFGPKAASPSLAAMRLQQTGL